jgi:hypothetical protein
MVDVQHVMHVEVFIAVRTLMSKSFALKVYQLRLMKFVNYSHAFHGRLQWVVGA